jgi:hypothetical protein
LCQNPPQTPPGLLASDRGWGYLSVRNSRAGAEGE